MPRLKPKEVIALRLAQFPSRNGPFTVYGNGRSYGDVCLTGDATLLKTRHLDRFIAFDPDTGVLECQAGVTLQEVLDLTVSQGWFLAVTPGTRFATVGGAIANDVHGKNHHSAGSFGHHVISLELVRSDGEILTCSLEENPLWFQATLGGLGLTGLIASVRLQLLAIESPWMRVVSQRFANLSEFWELNKSMEANWPYTVAWVDCLAKGANLGRGVYYAAKHLDAHSFQSSESLTPKPLSREKTLTFPLDSPISLVNNLSLRAFNSLYFRKPVEPLGGFAHYVPYFYPLDAIRHWNRIYGRKGFYQYQCVLPPQTSVDGINAMLQAISKSGQGSFLAVLKTFGERPAAGMLSFPRPGATLALDFPNREGHTQSLFETLDSIVHEAGGALYPAKDARMPAELFRQAFPAWEQFAHYIDPQLTSNFWKRITT
ncbi:FAD-binding oxidoreductase [Spongiibacter sp. KMU-158]|uniref:FAD-binding oxidoreductase n=1 Tax=Spongiibacter pelagi TaxID=2760804 RepID=A0A927C3B7_9GAMM|nr:FAD-binding oxidoreductase [Spongiibacter pelagi]